MTSSEVAQNIAVHLDGQVRIGVWGQKREDTTLAAQQHGEAVIITAVFDDGGVQIFRVTVKEVE